MLNHIQTILNHIYILPAKLEKEENFFEERIIESFLLKLQNSFEVYQGMK